MVVAASFAVSLGACASHHDVGAQGGNVAAKKPPEQALAVQDKILQLWNRVEAAKVKVAAANRDLTQLRQAVKNAQADLNRIPLVQQTLTSFGITLQELCAPSSAKAKQAQQRALKFLNLSCPVADRWKIDHPFPLPTTNVAAQEQKIVELLNRVEAAKTRVAAAQRDLTRQRQVATTAEALLNKFPNVQELLKSYGFTFDTLCVPVAAHGGGTVEQQAQHAREIRRQEALRMLKLTCPSP